MFTIIIILTSISEIQLSAHYFSIFIAPTIITNSTPDSIVTDFHTTLSAVISTHKLNVTFSTTYYDRGEGSEDCKLVEGEGFATVYTK